MLLEAAEHGRTECVGHTVAAGTDVNLTGSLHWKPLILASLLGHDDCVIALIKAGADVNVTSTKYSATPVWSALMSDVYFANALIKAGALLHGNKQFTITVITETLAVQR